MKRSRIKRKTVRRNWTYAVAKTSNEARCRGCGMSIQDLRRIGRSLETAHIIGRTFDEKLEDGSRMVHPDATIPLCGPATDTSTCHNKFDSHKLNLWHKLTEDEKAWASDRVGEGQARRRIEGRA